jgi:hypothetical protein
MRDRFRRLSLEHLEPRWCPSGAPAANFDKLGVYRPGDGSWSLDANGNGTFDAADTVYTNYSGPGVTPVVGDWDGDGRTEIGFFVDGIWGLDINGDGKQDNGDAFFDFGQDGDIPVAGDWNGDGKTKIGVFRVQPGGAGEFILDTNNDHMMDAGDTTFTFGFAGDKMVVGDWTGDGLTKVGVVRPNPNGSGSAVFSLDLANDHHYDGPQDSFVFGAATDNFIVGDWTHSGISQLGVYRPNPDGSGTAYFTLDTNGNRQYDPGVDEVFTFGLASDDILVGNWAFNPLSATAPAPTGLAATRLTQDQLNSAASQSLDAWAKAGLDPQHLAQLERLNYQIADLPGGELGVEKPGTIVIDPVAAGYGWNVDGGGMDLQTAVAHEQGHALGLSDADPAIDLNGLMADTLAPGGYRVPSTQDVTIVFGTGPTFN